MKSLDTSMAGKDYTGADLRGKDLTNKVLFSTNLKGAKLYGADISLQCATFDGCLLDSDQVGLLLLMIAQANIDRAWVEGIEELVRDVAGEHVLEVMQRYLKVV